MVSFPLLLIPLAIFNIIVFLMHDVSFTEPLFRLTLISGAEWGVSLSDVLLALGLSLLLLEIIKGARPGAKYVMDHLLSFVVFGGAAAEFLLWPKFASSTYFLLVLLALVEFSSGIALRTRRTPAATVPRRAQEPPAPSHPPDSAAASVSPTPVPSATSVAESVLLDHPALRQAHSPESAEPPAHAGSPALQPNTGSQASSEEPPR